MSVEQVESDSDLERCTPERVNRGQHVDDGVAVNGHKVEYFADREAAEFGELGERALAVDQRDERHAHFQTEFVERVCEVNVQNGTRQCGEEQRARVCQASLKVRLVELDKLHQFVEQQWTGEIQTIV